MTDWKLIDEKNQEIAELKSLAAYAEQRANIAEKTSEALKAKLQSAKADAVKSFFHEIGLYDSEFDDQEYIEVSRNSLIDHIEQLREGKS